MRAFTLARSANAPDEIWLTQHPSVYTLGLNGNLAHLREPSHIPLVRTDRGGQITWHGPGQLVAYTLIDLKRAGFGIRSLVDRLESAVISTLLPFGIRGERIPQAPGVYIQGAKIASVGLRIVRGCSYHGLSLNIDPDLRPFLAINPCGYAGLTVTSLADQGIRSSVMVLMPSLLLSLMDALGYPSIENQAH